MLFWRTVIRLTLCEQSGLFISTVNQRLILLESCDLDCSSQNTRSSIYANIRKRKKNLEKVEIGIFNEKIIFVIFWEARILFIIFILKIILDFIIPYHFLISQPLTLWVTKLRQFIQRGSKGATGFLDTFLCNNFWFGSENVQSEKAKRKQAWIRTSAAVWRDSRARWEIVSKRFWGRLILLFSFFFFVCFATCFRALLKIKNWNRTNDDRHFFEFQRPKYIFSNWVKIALNNRKTAKTCLDLTLIKSEWLGTQSDEI